MNPRATIACFAGNLAHWGIVNVLRRGGGNVPGAIALRLDPDLVGALGSQLEGSVVITGTNGKTTTNGLAADAIERSGKTVVCNRAGNNMESGIATALMLADGRGAFGCLECDELYTVRVLPRLRPRALVLLNLFRDQLDRYGEIDHTQDVIVEALRRSPETVLVFNADDPLCASVAGRVDNRSFGFGIDEPTGLEADRISDSRFCAACNAPLDYEYVHYGQLGSYRCPRCGWERPRLDFRVSNVCLEEGGYAFDVEDRRDGGDCGGLRLRSHYNGLHMVYNITAAFAASLIAGAAGGTFQGALDDYRPASGRGRTYALDGGCEAVSLLAKNPAGFDRMISQLRTENATLMAFFLNDNDADGHDVSWIWDVDFERLRLDRDEPRIVFVGGTRREDMAVRIKYAELGAKIVPIDSVADALAMCAGAPFGNGSRLHIVANYTAFPPVVAELERLEKAWSFPAESQAVSFDGAREAQAATEVALGRPLRIVHLYPDALNLYGDGGNIASLSKRCLWRGIPCVVDQVRMGERLDLTDADVVLLGGGSDRDQLAVANELRGQREKLASYVADGGALLAICGGYQLLGKYYMMGETRVEGLSILDIETTAGDTRLIGNVAMDSPICPSPIVGFENHAGRTLLGAGEAPLGSCLVPGTGNNGTDGGEGVLHDGVVGTYLHGPILPKNPGVTDWLIARALERRGIDVSLAPLDDALEVSAHDAAMRIALG